MMKHDHAYLRLHKILQRLKSLILKDLDAPEREAVKTVLTQLDEMYTKNQISIDEYKEKSMGLLLAYWSVGRRDEFLYRETGTFLTAAQRFALSQLPQKVRD